MYAGEHARAHPDRPAFVMASSGASVTYAELDARTNRLAHLLRAHGLQRLGHFSIFRANNDRFIEACGAGERTGLYYTCINSYLTADELAYILQNSESRLLVTSAAKLEVALKAIAQCPAVTLCLVVGGDAAKVRPAPTSGSARRCSTRRAPPGGRRACCARCRTTRRASRSRSFTS
jgi:long-chain acyl-CoA synthetase